MNLNYVNKVPFDTGSLSVKKKEEMPQKNQLFLLLSSQTPPSLRATSPNLGEELSYLARWKANSESIF